MNGMDRAKALLFEGRALAVVGEKTYTSDEKGIKALFELAEKKALRGAAVADKIVGRAAALLMAEGKAAEVYAATLSEGGKAVFDAAGVKYA